jgi:hypothetical protein
MRVKRKTRTLITTTIERMIRKLILKAYLSRKEIAVSQVRGNGRISLISFYTFFRSVSNPVDDHRRPGKRIS